MRTLNHHTFLLLIIPFVLSGFQDLHAQPDIKFQRITINDGLSLSSVYRIYQDSKGFMWFATEDGLNKYDGREFTIYNHTPSNSNSLSYKWIENILEDRYGNFWLSSRHGITRLNPASEKLDRFLAGNDGHHKILNDTVISMALDGDYLWAGTMNGLNLIQVKTGEVSEIDLDCRPGRKQVYTISVDEQGRAWIGTKDGLHVAYTKSGKATRLAAPDPGKSSNEIHTILPEKDTLWVGTNGQVHQYLLTGFNEKTLDTPVMQYSTNSRVERIHRDRSGQLWFVTGEALLKQSADTLKTVVETPDNSPSLAILPRKPLVEDHEGNLWLGTFGKGAYKILSGTGKIIRYAYDPSDPGSLSDNTVNCIFEDRANGIWLGTFGAGISVYAPRLNLIKNLTHNAFDPNSLSSNFIWSICEMQDGSLWVGTNTTGISVYDPGTENFHFLQHEPDNPGSLPGSSVREIFQGKDGTVWIGTDGGGLSRYDPDKGDFKHFRYNPDDPATISSNSVRTIFEDSTGILWLGTRHGLNKFNPITEKFTRYLHDPDDNRSISHNFIYSAIYMDKRGFLWVGTYGGGLNMMDTERGRFIRYQFDHDDPASLSDDIVFDIHEDEKGYFWIGTNSGLNLFNPATGKFKRYGLDEGMPNEVVYGIMPDRSNRLWMTTNKGVSRLDLTEFRFKNFDVQDGLQSNEFNGGAFHNGRSGLLYAGGIYGLSIIDPKVILPVENRAELIISRLEILGKDVRVVTDGMLQDTSQLQNRLIESVENFYLPKHVTYLEEIRLDYDQRFFSLEFAALNHHIPEKLNYRYRLLNLEEHWNIAGNRNYVTYANMKPGTYIFEADAINPDGFLSARPAQLKITITPPFWRSYWFMLLIAMLVMGFVIFIYRYLLNQRTNKMIKEHYEQIKAAHKQLQISENNLIELNATKDKFFSIISHDLKNPFTSVLSISELMATNFDETDPDDIRFGVNKIHQTNKHIYELLENLLTWSKTQRGNIAVEEVKFNLSRIIETNINILKLAAEKKHIEIVNNADQELCAVADREMISTVFRNLVNNAIKFTPPGRKIQINSFMNKKHVIVEVRDEGVGIAPEDKEKLFRIDDKFKTEGTQGEKGTGLGLIICKEFVEKNGGTIEVESSPGKGSTFRFTIPSEKQQTIL
jgi:signal transduction histidine kinase/ligand-binding sensor domain-containing protein